MKRAAVDELRSEEMARLSPLRRLRADSHDIEEGSQGDIHPAIELLDEVTPRSEDKEEVLTPINNVDEDCSWLFESQSSGVLEGVGDRLWWHSNLWHELDERRKDWLSNHQSFKPATTNDLMRSLNPDLCKFCRIFFDDWASIIRFKNESESSTNYFGAVHYETFDELGSSALEGCNLCTLFSGILQLGKERKNLRGFPEDLRPAGFLQLQEREDDKAEVGDIDTWWIRLHLTSTEANEEESFNKNREMQPMVGLTRRKPSQAQPADSAFILEADSSQLNSKLVAEPFLLPRNWLEECRSEHEACRSNDQLKAPTRLIKIDDGVVRLCLSAEETSLPTYATLSHCWGTLKFLRLLKENISLFMDHIPLVELPKTFLDAIEIARNLGFSWLWIDSLCIIQDDKEDWRRESSLMATVYGQSGLNIAATAAPDGRTGCLFERNSVWAQNRQIKVDIDGEIRTYDYAYFRLLSDNIFNAPLNTRAWVVQERLLAPRTLHFGSNEIIWECKTKYACAAFPEGMPKSFHSHISAISRRHLWINWRNIVWLYSICSLKNQSDKLVALAGVARKVYEETGDDYFSGFWRKNLQEHLCWSRQNDNLYLGQRSDLRIPSWSWASVQGEVALPEYYDETSLDSYMRLVDVCVALAGDDPFGDVERGILTVSSKLMTCCWVNPPSPDIIQESRGLNDDKVLVGNRLLKSIRAQVRWDHEPNYSCKCVLFLVNIRKGAKSAKCLSGLLLKSTNEEKGQYERVGLLEVWGIEGLGGNLMKHLEIALEQFSEILKESKEVTDFPTEADCISTDYDEEGTKMYTVTIV